MKNKEQKKAKKKVSASPRAVSSLPNKSAEAVLSTALEPFTFQIEGMTCSSCVATVERTLKKIPGISASVNFASETAHIMAPAELNPKIVIAAVKSAGYKAKMVSDSNQLALHNRHSATALFFATFFTLPLIVISMMTDWHPKIDEWVNQLFEKFNFVPPQYSPTMWLVIALSAPVVVIIAWPIHRSAVRNILHPTMDTLISLGSLSAFGWSIYSNVTGIGNVYAEAAATVILFVILGRYLESRAKRKASSALATLLALGSKVVTVIRDGEEEVLPIDHLDVGDIFVVKPGEKFATDGIVVSGTSSVDNSLLTGESRPVEVSAGSAVIGASLNQNGRLEVRATRIGSDTELARITAMVINAQGTKAPIQRLADRISAVFVPFVTLIAIGTYFAWSNSGATLTKSITSAIAVLVIACPCALGLATPVALLVASGRGARRGIVIRQPRVLEVARKLNAVVLDKTGTLTDGRMTLVHATVIPSAGKILGAPYKDLLIEPTILSSALSIERQSDHPIATSITAFVESKGIRPTTVSEFSVTPGAGSAGRVNLGLVSPVVLIGSPLAVAHATTPFAPEIEEAINQAEREGLTASVLSWDGVALAVFAVGDQIKPDAKATIAALKKRGIEPWLVTGDSPEVARVVALQVGIAPDHVVAAALPETKVTHVKKLQKKGMRVLMIGDGVNDAAALATADLSMAMGTGTDTAIATADLVLMRRQLRSVIEALDLSKKTLRIIKTNLGWAFLYNVICIPIAAMGQLQPMYAAAAMAFSSLFVVTNSLRIR
jgi:Cu+-exporting ATPase